VDGALVADLGALDAEGLGLGIDPLGGRALSVEVFVGGGVTVKQDAAEAASLDVDIFDAARSLGELLMVTRWGRRMRMEQGAAELLGAIAVGVVERIGGLMGSPVGQSGVPSGRRGGSGCPRVLSGMAAMPPRSAQVS